MKVQHDGKVAISIGGSRYEKIWKNSEITWSVLLRRLSKSKDTGETAAEYAAMPKDDQDKVKDIGGFVGGHLRGGSRRTGCVECRQLLTLDLDSPPEDLWERIVDDFELDFAMAIYSTHKHGPGHPRLRLIAPLSRRVNADEYEAIARKIAEKIGLDYCDDSTFQPTRLMYWPSHSTDAPAVFESYDAEWLDADAVLAEYGGHWDDTSYWPESSRQPGIRKALAKKQGNPTEKTGIVGAFCRTYDVPAAIEKFLSGVYVPTGKGDRYTYASGSSSGGLAVYDNGLFAFSNHATDPASGQLCNSFDLVRLHHFGHLDDPADGLSGSKTKSYAAMAELASRDPAVKATLSADQKSATVLDFRSSPLPGDENNLSGCGGGTGGPGGGTGGSCSPGAPDFSWEDKLDRDKTGAVRPTVTNAVLILSKHPDLQSIKYNELSHAIEVSGRLPWDRPNKYWRESDEAQLYTWVADNYKVQFPDCHFQRALRVAVDGRRFSPIRDYISSLPTWDGVERLNTLLHDYLGAEDSEYVRAVTRATMVGAIRRALEPGCKHDTAIVLAGPEGLGKSTLLSRLGGEFFSDSIKLTDMRDKTAAEKIHGVWLMEAAEMQGRRKADVESVKAFLSTQIDRYRPSYGRVVEQFPRSSIVWGTTNQTDGFLTSITGNRRFWPVYVAKGAPKDPRGLTREEAAQIWSETLAAYNAGEKNYLDPDMEAEAVRRQQAALEHDDREGMVSVYLDTPIPDDFYTWDDDKRADYFRQPDHYAESHANATLRRSYVSALEIWVECLCQPLNKYERKSSYDIASIMAGLPGWSKSSDRRRIGGYGQQRVYTRD